MVVLHYWNVIHCAGKKKLPHSGNTCFILVTGNTLNSHKEVMGHLRKQISGLKEVFSVDVCDFVLVFCPVVSKSEVNIRAALQQLNRISDTKPAVLVVLHHTFDPERVVPDSSRAVNRKNMITVDCLFHEDQGLLQCHKNYKALEHIKKWRKPESRAIFGGHKDQKTPKQMTVQEQENPKALITQRTQSMEGLPPKMNEELSTQFFGFCIKTAVTGGVWEECSRKHHSGQKGKEPGCYIYS